MRKSILDSLLRGRMLSKRRTEYANLFAQLSNVQVCYDLKPATDDELLHLWGNTVRLLNGLLSEMKQRGIDIDDVTEQTKAANNAGALRNE